MSLGCSAAFAAEVEGQAAPVDSLTESSILEELATTTIVGSKEKAWQLAGSAAYLDTSDIRDQSYNNVNRVLAKVPGVYVREEDGFGNFPNISIRGVDGTRSSKVTLMEDGVIAAPAPYSAPAAYYSPAVARMAGLEVLKGSSQIKYGPHTTGGVINYLSTPVPEEETFYAKATYGSWNSMFLHANYGNTVQTKNGKVGYLAELLYQSSDGYEKLPNGGDTGYQRIEPMFKVFWEPDSAAYQRVEFKYGYTDFEQDQGYLGLTEDDVRNNPHDRYAATQFDNMDSSHHRTALSYTVHPQDNVQLNATAYYNKFKRNWYKLNKVDDQSLNKALLDPASVSILKGMSPGSIEVKGNDRAYDSYGVQFVGDFQLEHGEVYHNISSGLRFHYDSVQRDQYRDNYATTGNGSFGGPVRDGDYSDTRFDSTFATSLFLEDDISFGAWTVKPGVRIEHMNYEYRAEDGAETQEDSLTAVSGGIGATYTLDDNNLFYGGIYRGISTPGAKAAITSSVENEESLSLELGWRTKQNGVLIDLAGFYTDYSNLIARESIGTGQNDDENAGDARIWGIESLISYDYAAENGFSYNLPTYLSVTYSKATLQNALEEGGGDGIWAGGEDGAMMPYVPEWKLAAGVGYAAHNWGANLDMTYVSGSYGTAKNLDAPVDSAREGKIDDALLFDVSAWYQINENWRLLGGVHNLFDEQYITTRLPEGPRSGAPRQLYAGFEVTF